MSNVDHPKHYNMGGIEPIEFISDRCLGFNLGNAVKYIVRAEHKNGVEDYEKAIWYLTDLKDRSKKYGPVKRFFLRVSQSFCKRKIPWSVFTASHSLHPRLSIALGFMGHYDLTLDPGYLIQAILSLKLHVQSKKTI